VVAAADLDRELRRLKISVDERMVGIVGDPPSPPGNDNWADDTVDPKQVYSQGLDSDTYEFCLTQMDSHRIPTVAWQKLTGWVAKTDPWNIQVGTSFWIRSTGYWEVMVRYAIEDDGGPAATVAAFESGFGLNASLVPMADGMQVESTNQLSVGTTRDHIHTFVRHFTLNDVIWALGRSTPAGMSLPAGGAQMSIKRVG
jgi:hypothetical protein